MTSLDGSMFWLFSEDCMTKQDILNLMYEFRFVSFEARADCGCDTDQCVLANLFADELLEMAKPVEPKEPSAWL